MRGGARLAHPPGQIQAIGYQIRTGPLLVSGAVPILTACRVCNGRLELAQRGSGSATEPSAFRPSYHRMGEHGDLYRCCDCGTVQQPSLPRGTELHDLYREMSDDASYLAEE